MNVSPSAVPEGLTDEQAAAIAATGQVNRLHRTRDPSTGQILRKNLCTVFNLVNFLIAAAVLIAGSPKNVLFLGVVFSNLLIGIVQELRARNAVRRLNRAAEAPIAVLRSGVERPLSKEAIVTGDLIHLKVGDRVPADGILIAGSCEGDLSALTGEAEPVTLTVGDSLYAGAFIVSGTVFLRVTAVGEDTREAEISRAAHTHKPAQSEIMRTLNRIVSVMALVILPIGALLLWRQTRLSSLRESVITVGAALVSMIPEGLMLLTSSVLALGVIRLSQSGVLCRELASIEGLARVDLLCLDKTGTLTGGNMEFAALYPLAPFSETEIRRLLTRLTACGDASSVMTALQQAFPPDTSATPLQILDFSAARKRSGALFCDGAYLLGAPDWVMRPNTLSDAVQTVLDALPPELHTLLFIRSSTLPADGAAPPDAVPLAVIALRDRIRESAPSTLRYFQEQGVTLRVISGDSAATASYAAERAGVPNAQLSIDASALSDEALTKAAESYVVFGRVTPSQKRILVEAYRKMGHTVAMTGDGVNDIPAMRAADCSIAMASGAEAAKAVAKLVLLHSDFDAMPRIVAEGRRCIHNLQRSAALFLVKTVYAAFLAVLFVFAPWTYPFIPIQLTLVSAFTIGTPSFLLALEPCFDPLSGKFLTGVLRRSLPGSFAVMLTLPSAELLLRQLSASDAVISTVCTALCATAGLLTVLHACLPFNRWRGTVFLTMLLLFCIGFFGFPTFFELDISAALPYLLPSCGVCAGILEGSRALCTASFRSSAR